MAFFALSGIVGCITSGETDIVYGTQYNDALINLYYKKDYKENGVLKYYGVICVIGNVSNSFKFNSITDRDTFYTSLP